MTTPRLLLTLALLATSLAMAAPPATAKHTITLSIPYALLVHADAYTTETIELEDATHLVIEARAPLRLFIQTNDRWRLTVRTTGGPSAPCVEPAARTRSPAPTSTTCHSKTASSSPLASNEKFRRTNDA